ncbi:MAG: SoxR reducing system RseC family protein [Gammaproteobacteria bacterium]|nr:SoxR reducing system RseC family protein [Gammaproteobacteria bacterium]
MIEENARIVAVEDDAVWVEARRESACGRCALRSGCGHGLLDGLRRSRALHLRLPRPGVPSLEVDDRVVLGIAEGAILRASARMYGLPHGRVWSSAPWAAQAWRSGGGALGATGLLAGAGAGGAARSARAAGGPAHPAAPRRPRRCRRGTASGFRGRIRVRRSQRPAHSPSSVSPDRVSTDRQPSSAVSESVPVPALPASP